MTALPVPPGVGVAAVLAALRRWGVGGKVAELLCPFPRGVGVAAVLAALRRWGGREGSTKLLCPFRGRGPGRAKLCLPDPATARYRRGTSLPTRNIAPGCAHPRARRRRSWLTRRAAAVRENGPKPLLRRAPNTAHRGPRGHTESTRCAPPSGRIESAHPGVRQAHSVRTARMILRRRVAFLLPSANLRTRVSSQSPYSA